MELAHKKVETKENLNLRFDYEKGEIRLFGARIALTNFIPACEKIDQMFGTGGEVIVSCMAFEQGRQLFEAMMVNNPNESKEELLREAVDLQPQGGWGITSLRFLTVDPPEVEVAVKNSPVKTLKGSSKHLIGSFWAGVLSEYFIQQLKCVSFSYDETEDRLCCTITA